MGLPTAKRRLVIYGILLGCGLGVCGWQAEEHFRFKRNAETALINRGRDITSTLGVLLRAQRRIYGSIVISKERLESALQDLVRPEELESISVLGATGATIASAGTKVDLTPDMLAAGGPYWRDRSVTIMNLMDLSATGGEEGARARPRIVVADDDRQARALGTFRPQPARRAAEPGAVPGAPGTTSPAPAGEAASSTSPATSGTAAAAPDAQPTAAGRSVFGRPSGMPKEDYDALIQKQGVHSLVLSLSTADMRRKVSADLLLRSLVSLLAMGGAILSVLAWRNLTKNSELQIRLVKAGEMNTHLKEMNFAAAGLAHETRNPLNLIRGLAQMISMQTQNSPKLREHASTIIEEADRVTVQLNEFINYSKPREAHLGPVQVQRLVADVARTLVPDIEEKQITLRQPESPLLIEADEQLLRQALFNVLLNATQAVAPGGRIEIWLNQSGPRDATLEIADDGPGVPAAERANIFKPYVTMRPKGVGLGLAIVQQIASAHHWEVTCDANEPHGAVFRFSRLKLAAPAA
ncbi:MAG: ATP-binding protein [Verrucomicrobia bacterium]|nr:ATP-binding protein [Verrucomicrobiota bacterium]